MSEAKPARCVHDVGSRDDRDWTAVRVFGGPRVIHRRRATHATRDVGPGDGVVPADSGETQAVAARNAADLDARWL